MRLEMSPGQGRTGRVSPEMIAAFLADDGWAARLRERQEAQAQAESGARKGRGALRAAVLAGAGVSSGAGRAAAVGVAGAGRPAAQVRHERDGVEALVAGHPASWRALWRGEAVPPFPGLLPMGTPEPKGRPFGGEVF